MCQQFIPNVSYLCITKYSEAHTKLINFSPNPTLKVLNTYIYRVDANYETATFTRTPIMSTYLIAFIVSKFTCSAGEDIDTNIPHQVCSRNDTAIDRALANNYGPQLMRTLQNITNITYAEMNIGKMDQVAIPDFSAGAMENWGLVTYRLASLFLDKVFLILPCNSYIYIKMLFSIVYDVRYEKY